jgi:hypothetical protein
MTDDGHDAQDDAREAARQRRIADACLLREPLGGGRLGLYRRLVQTNLSAVVRRLLPRTAGALEAREEGAWGAWFARFLAEAGPRTPYLRDVPGELVAWAAPLWQTASVPPFVGDLARYEIDLFEMDGAPVGAAPPPLTEVALDRRLVFATPRKLARYDYAVHELASDPPRRATCVLIHRDADNIVHSTPLDAPIGDLIEQTLAGLTLGDALAESAASAKHAHYEDARLEVARVLAELAAKGALLGGEG